MRIVINVSNASSREVDRILRNAGVKVTEIHIIDGQETNSCKDPVIVATDKWAFEQK